MQCDVFNPVGNGTESYRCHRDAIRECADCRQKLCRQDAHLCCDQYWCEFCLGFHQTSDDHVPFVELVS